MPITPPSRVMGKAQRAYRNDPDGHGLTPFAILLDAACTSSWPRPARMKSPQNAPGKHRPDPRGKAGEPVISGQ
ncbi:MAG: hypothetical protein ACKO24_00835 [Leptolyngbyaceae cyanobacterium]